MKDLEIKYTEITGGSAIPYCVVEGDLPGASEDWANIRASMDIETSGFQPKDSKIALVIVQPIFPPELGLPKNLVFLVRRPTDDPLNLKALMANPKPKLFHQVSFDINFIKDHWDLGVNDLNGLRCTLVAQKVLDPKKDLCMRNLKTLVNYWCDIEIPKGKATSNWFAPELTEQQIIYAIEDVHFLGPIWQEVGKRLDAGQRAKVIKTCEYLPSFMEHREDGIKNPYVH